MNQKERMLRGLAYKAWEDGLPEERMSNKMKLYEFNHCRPNDTNKQQELIYSILGKAGENLHIKSPFYCDYGYNIEVGKNFYANLNCTILDVGKVMIVDNVMFGPNVALYTLNYFNYLKYINFFKMLYFFMYIRYSVM